MSKWREIVVEVNPSLKCTQGRNNVLNEGLKESAKCYTSVNYLKKKIFLTLIYRPGNVKE